jgi:hypothetical protein
MPIDGHEPRATYACSPFVNPHSRSALVHGGKDEAAALDKKLEPGSRMLCHDAFSKNQLLLEGAAVGIIGEVDIAILWWPMRYSVTVSKVSLRFDCVKHWT